MECYHCSFGPEGKTYGAPLRLPLGDDAILGHLDGTRADITTWEKLARDTRLGHQQIGDAARPVT